MSFYNFPEELRNLDQWVLWRLEKTGNSKPTKMPYVAQYDGGKASVIDPLTWRSFETCLLAPLTCIEPCDPKKSVSETGYSGIGFVFSEKTNIDGVEYTGIDLDAANNPKIYQQQLKIFNAFNSYSELSPSGQGCHIIVKGNVPKGRRRDFVEVYSNSRFFTVTGNVINNQPIEYRQELLDILYKEMGNNLNTTVNIEYEDKAETRTDYDIYEMASTANNGGKFVDLWAGNFQPHYQSQSEADFALINMLCFYSENRKQIIRMFRMSALGKRQKAYREDYITSMLNRSFDQKLPSIDIDSLKISLEKMLDEQKSAVGKIEQSPTAEPQGDEGAKLQTLENEIAILPTISNEEIIYPKGLIGEITEFIYKSSPRPAFELAFATAIAFMAGICGKAYNIEGGGLNMYILSLAMTGAGKDVTSSGISKLMYEISKQNPSIYDFKGAGEIGSAQGLFKWIAEKPCSLSIIGEFGVKLKEMCNPAANIHLQSLQRALLQLYSKSGQAEMLDAMAYSDKTKNTEMVKAPSFSLIGESVPETFWEIVDDRMISSGLLPRFMIFEYKGNRSYFNKLAMNVEPSYDLIYKLSNLVANCQSLMAGDNVINVQISNDAEKLFGEFDKWTTDDINKNKKNQVISQMWNRCHLKALRLAGLFAVGNNQYNPIVDYSTALWAIDVVKSQAQDVISKYKAGDMGSLASNEGRQIKEVCRIIFEYISVPYEAVREYTVPLEMHRDGIIPENFIYKRVQQLGAFRNDRMGVTFALKRALKSLVEGDDLREVSKVQLQANYQKSPKSYVVYNPDKFKDLSLD